MAHRHYEYEDEDDPQPVDLTHYQFPLIVYRISPQARLPCRLPRLRPGQIPGFGSITDEPAADSAVDYDTQFRAKDRKNMASYQLADGAATRHSTCDKVD